MKKLTIQVSTCWNADLTNIGNVADTIMSHYDAIIHAYESAGGLEAWFTEYVAGPHFAALRPETKKDTLQSYLGLYSLIEHLHKNLEEK